MQTKQDWEMIRKIFAKWGINTEISGNLKLAIQEALFIHNKQLIDALLEHTFVIPQGHITRGLRLTEEDLRELFSQAQELLGGEK